MNVWERLGNTQAYLKQTGKIANPFNSDGKVNFGVALDVAKNLPENAGSFNNNIEAARQKILQDEAITSLGTPKGILYGGLTGAMIPGVGAGLGVGLGTTAYSLAELDKKTDGKVSKALMAGTMNVRSNYAYVSDVAKHDAGLGFLSGLTVLVGGVVGAIGGGLAGFAVGGVGAVPGAIAGFSIGAAAAGSTQRKTAKAGVYDFISKDLKNSARYSETVAGQEQYNFGRDAYRNTIGVAAKITGHEEIGDPTKGFGAIMSGALNIMFEVSTAPDIKALKLAGVVAKGTVLGGVTTQSTTFLEGKLKKYTGENDRIADRVAADVDLLKKTAAGEETVYTPVFKFIRENDAAAISERSGFKGDGYGQMAATLLAGKSNEAISLVMRVARGDKEAMTELSIKQPAMHAEILRYESAIQVVESSGTQRIAFGFNLGGKPVAVSKKTLEIVEAELTDLRGQYSWLNRSLDLDSALQESTVAKFKGIEDFKNKIATGRIERKLEADTKYGLANETVFQRNGLSVLIRKVNRVSSRVVDDAPHSTVNFNDVLQSNSRVRTSSRMAVNKGLILPAEARNLYNEFLIAKNEGQKDLFVDKFTETIFERVAAKHGVPSSMRDAVLNNWNKIRRDSKAKAQEAKVQNKAYMIDDAGDVIQDPQLISQLANGAYLPDVELIDKAFAAYAKRKGPEAGLPINVAVLGLSGLDEFNSLWRTFTLARVGFPINIMRDSTLRTWGDAILFDSLRNLGEDAWKTMLKSTNTVKEMRNWSVSVTNPKRNLSNIRQQIIIRDAAIRDAEKSLKRFDYDPAKPPKEIPFELQKTLDYIDEVKKTTAELRRQENFILTQKPDGKVVAADKMPISGYQFNAPFSGRLGEISFQKLRGKDDIRGLVASTRELEMNYIRSDRDGGRAILATENEVQHLASWESILNNQLRNDEVARQIMARTNKNMTPAQIEKEVVGWIRSPESGNYLERFGYDKELKREFKFSDAKHVFDRVNAAITQFAPDSRLHKLIMEDKLNIDELKKMFPDINKRPAVITDLVNDLTGNSNIVRSMSNWTKDVVTWLATVPTSRLSYNPYFAAKYQQKLQNMVAIANAQGRRLSDMDQNQFEAVARNHALTEYRKKINAFNRDMNYPGLINYVMAFFPAVVEQYRAYGHIFLDHPEFPYKILAMSNIPDQIGNVQVDEFGTEYVEVELPLLGGDIKGRLPTFWFNAVNPTGGHILSAGPVASASVNAIAKRVDLPNWFTETVLPFGVQANTAGALTPGTLRRAGQAFQATFLGGGEQFNKDKNMFLELKRKDFEDSKHKKPSGSQLAAMGKEAEDDALKLSLIRALGSGILPAQPRYVTPLQVYSNLLSKYQKEYGEDGAERFTNDYPEYYLLVDKLTDSTSGLRSDDTAVNLVRKNGDTVEKIVATLGQENLSVLGSIFNDDDYAFSSAAQAYLVDNTIPGTRKKFKEQGDALENNRSSIVNKGWKDWNQMIEVVSIELEKNNLTPGSGYGAVVLDSYKNKFMESAKENNNLWWLDKQGSGYTNKMNSTITALTIAANTPKLWKELAKQPRWHSLVDYLVYRYKVKAALEQRGASITSKNASDIKDAVGNYVTLLRKQDVNFGKFYDRYFADDDFKFTYDE